MFGERVGSGEAATLDATLAWWAGGEVSSSGDDANEDLPSSQGSLLIVVRAWSFLGGAVRIGLGVSCSFRPVVAPGLAGGSIELKCCVVILLLYLSTRYV
jgi:hypothetical protein